MEIDFVVTWVDMDDPKWKEEFYKYSDKIDNSVNEKSEARFRDYGFLKYWFRGVDLFAPWVRKVHFVTSGQKPEWLNIDHPKLNMVSHKDYIPEEYLPVFNSNLIEIYMHKIPDLSEQFVYFNDDFFITNHLSPTRFFENGLPKDIAAFRKNTGISQFEKMLKNNIRLINKHFDKREVFKRDAWKWYEPSYGSRGRLNYLLKFAITCCGFLKGINSGLLLTSLKNSFMSPLKPILFLTASISDKILATSLRPRVWI